MNKEINVDTKPPKSNLCARPVLSITGSSDVTSTVNLMIDNSSTYTVKFLSYSLIYIQVDRFVVLNEKN